MDPNNKSIITEDGRRLIMDNGAITGTEDPGEGLAYQTGNTTLNEAGDTDAEENTDNTTEE